MGKLKEFVKDHKKVLIVSAVVVGGATLLIVGHKLPVVKDIGSKNAVAKALCALDSLQFWKADGVYEGGGHLLAYFSNIPIDDLDRVNRTLIAHEQELPMSFGKTVNVIIESV